ncbi:MAG: alpha-ketoglutarate-dependent dioxygenase AlkB [Oleiphilaceae bacterium]|nr:alpha-ketoglutarate-dependent dioxygenase AlkB [Oleiphilaceae bacterium]
MDYSLGSHQLQLTTPFLEPEQARLLEQHLMQALPWRQERIRLFGRERLIPRQQCWVGDPEAQYRYSGLTLVPEPWTGPLAALRDQVSRAAGESFNSVLCNLYRHGQDSMGWHSDDEPELGPDPVIASVSLGQERPFHFRHQRDQYPRLKLVLPHNSLLVMPAGLQREWQHQLPKSRRVLGPRINLTFRRVVPVADRPDNG